MKIGNPANYYVQVWPAWWDEPDDVAELQRDIFGLVLNMVVRVSFVPDVRSVPRPWRMPDDPVRTAEEARVVAALGAPFAVTPDDARAGRSETIGLDTDDLTTRLFFVTARDFATYRDELAALTESAATTNPSVRHDDIADRAVIRFVDTHVLSHVSRSAIAGDRITT